jgi:hypothetical protein
MGKRLSPLERLEHSVAHGAITLVLGAGVSLSRGVPTWRELAARIWKRAHGTVLALPGHPFELQFAFELASHALDERRRERTGRLPAPFARALREVIYSRSAGPARGGDSLSIVAGILRREHPRPDRRIARVITFNVDDHLERDVHRGRSWKARPIVWPVSRESHSPRHAAPRPIPVYHIHGFLPLRPDTYPSAPDALVFTDAEYWSTVAQPSGFANRVVAHALHDSACIFVGLSMSDVNLIRWLGLRAVVVEADRTAQYPGLPEEIRSSTRRALQRHFWIRPDADDPTGLVSALLERRGVTSVPIDGWGAPALRAVLARVFGSL